MVRRSIYREGWALEHVYRNAGISGASVLRPGYQVMMKAVRDGAFDVVVAEALDRLSRDQKDAAALFKCLRFAGTKSVTLAEGEIRELHVADRRTGGMGQGSTTPDRHPGSIRG